MDAHHHRWLTGGLYFRYDRNKLSLKEIMNVQYISCMNPTAGSFTINPRLQVQKEAGMGVTSEF
jgi:hypothetical protein